MRALFSVVVFLVFINTEALIKKITDRSKAYRITKAVFHLTVLGVSLAEQDTMRLAIMVIIANLEPLFHEKRPHVLVHHYASLCLLFLPKYTVFLICFCGGLSGLTDLAIAYSSLRGSLTLRYLVVISWGAFVIGTFLGDYESVFEVVIHLAVFPFWLTDSLCFFNFLKN